MDIYIYITVRIVVENNKIIRINNARLFQAEEQTELNTHIR
jgi:hypothetical protein